MGGWIGLIASLLGKNKQPQTPLQPTQVSGLGSGGMGENVGVPQVRPAQQGGGGFANMLSQCTGPNAPPWCKIGSAGGAGGGAAEAGGNTGGSLGGGLGY